MKPNRGEGMSGPELQPAALPEVSEVIPDNKPEQAPARPETSPSKQTTPPVVAAPLQLPADDNLPVIPSDEDHPSLGSQPSGDKDGDRIERHWVDSAKNIINHTKDDPYKQKKEMSKFKADYIKQRFNKVVKADQEAL